ncbi:unnamed protein product [Blepharisma stoltei]|uniref:Uncharacterized protein n=1 Tax=Blepharisma stoltei TaxID=1481888 RepID=A0AAU9J6G8_9CILI|nr:unnamed protein product [Blepharisma stoltei]
MKCTFKGKIERYSQALHSKTWELFDKVSGNEYVWGNIVRRAKYWREWDVKVGNSAAQKLLKVGKNPFDLLHLGIYGVKTGQAKYLEKMQNEWKTVGPMIGIDEMVALEKVLMQEEGQENRNIIRAQYKPEWKALNYIKYLNHPDVSNIEISENSREIAIEIEGRWIVLVGCTADEMPLNPILNLINRYRIQAISVPLPHPETLISSEEARLYINKLVEDRSSYREEPGVQMIAKNQFGLKMNDIYSTMVLRSCSMKQKILLSAPSNETLMTWATQIPDIKQYFDEVRVATFLDLCEVLDSVAEKGCNLCTKSKKVPTEKFVHSLLSSDELTEQYMDYMAFKIQSFTNKENVLILLPIYLLHTFAKKFLTPATNPLIFQQKVSAEELAIASFLFNDEEPVASKQFSKEEMKEFLDIKKQSEELLQPSSFDLWPKEIKKENQCFAIYRFIKQNTKYG